MNLLIESLLSVMYPPLCPCCSTVMTRGEGPMCLGCRLSLPLTGFENSPAENEMMDKLQGLIPIEGAVAYFRYRRDAPQAALIHDMKYRGVPSIGRRLAREYAVALQDKGFFKDIDAIIPVPLNFWRHCRRGFNQSAWIARGVADITGLPIVNGLRARAHSSQTKLGAEARQKAAANVYHAYAKALQGLHHILLTDDICTTGATLYSCATALHTANPSLKISVMALAATSLI